MDRELTRPALVALLIVVTVAVVLGFILGAYVYAPGDGGTDPAPATFSTASELHEDRILHTFTPDPVEGMDYRVSYEVMVEEPVAGSPGDTLTSVLHTVDDRVVRITEADPFVIEIEDRKLDAAYEVDIRIHDELDRLVHQAGIRVGPYEVTA